MKSLARARLYMSDTVHDGVDAIPTDDTYLAISRALSITGPNASKPQVEGTDMDDTGRVYEGDLPEQGDLVAELNQDFGDAGQTQALEDAQTAGQTRWCKIEWIRPTDNSVVRTAYVLGEVVNFSQNASQGDFHKATVTVRLSGSATYSGLGFA